MKLFVYSLDAEEKEFFDEYTRQFGLEWAFTEEAPNLNNADLCRGFEYISILPSTIDRDLIARYLDNGVKMVSTRTIGYDHLDLQAARSGGLRLCNAKYSPDSIADFTIMLLLMAIRNAKHSMERTMTRNYSVSGLKGKSLRNLTVGVIGTGRIGMKVIERLVGFGCKILAYTPHPGIQQDQAYRYVGFDELIAQSDVITLHAPATKENAHMINADTFSRMRRGAVLINTARGSIVDTRAMMEALKTGQLSAAGLDTIEGEETIFYSDCTSKIVELESLSILKDYPNVIITPHIAYYTDESIRDKVYSSVESCYFDMKRMDNPYRIVRAFKGRANSRWLLLRTGEQGLSPR